MSRTLRVRLEALHRRLGTAGLVVAVLALVLALTGAAIAASGGLTPKQKKQVIAIAKKYAGKPGPAGPTGPTGVNGANGKDGSNGTNGTDGAPGKSVISTAFVGSEEMTLFGEEPCEERGGTALEVEGSSTEHFACNGKAGEPWTPNNVLPSKATETGDWAIGLKKAPTLINGGVVRTAISFPIPLSTAFVTTINTLGSGRVQSHEIGYNGEDKIGAEHEHCPGKNSNPQAAPGYLCVYFGLKVNSTAGRPVVESSEEEFNQVDRSGTTVGVASLPEEEKQIDVRGTWAITAP